MNNDVFANVVTTENLKVTIGSSAKANYDLRVQLRCEQERRGLGLQEFGPGLYMIKVDMHLKIRNGFIVAMRRPLYLKTKTTRS